MDNKLEIRLQSHKIHYASLQKCKAVVTELLKSYSKNFPEYTDHSLEHTQRVCDIAGEILNESEINNLSEDEIYVLCMACYLHDIGMCIVENKISIFRKSIEFDNYKKSYRNSTFSDFIRDIHHELSYQFILKEWKSLHIHNEKFATAIGLTAMAHRKVDLMESENFKPQYFIKSGREFICLPYLGCIIRLADELDITNMRVPDLLFDYHLPDNKKSREEWEKHKSTYQVNYTHDTILIEAETNDQSIYHALKSQYNKIYDILNYCQKVINRTCKLDGKSYTLNLNKVEPIIKTNFTPRNIGFTFDVGNVFNTLIGEHLYNNTFAGVREAIQNSIDTCNYKKLQNKKYNPVIEIILEDNKLIIQDNGLGMDEFIVKNYFSKLASSYYVTEKLKKNYEAIGQFGIGVFSYFLLCDSFEVETAMKNNEKLKFLVNRSPDRYFYFYNDVEDVKEGTKITMYLNHSISYDSLYTYLRATFAYLTIDLNFTTGDKKDVISKRKFDFNSDIDSLKQNIRYIHSSKSESINIFHTKINNSEFEGIYGLIGFKDSTGLVTFKGLYSFFDSDYYREVIDDSLLVYQKGIFVGKVNQSRINQCLRYGYSKVNIIKKTQLNLNRNDFSNLETITNIINKFEIKITNEIFKLYRSLNKKLQFHKTSIFIDQLLERYSNINESYRKCIEDNFLVCIFEKSKIRYEKLRNLKKYKKIIFNDEIKEGNHLEFKDKLINLEKIHKSPILLNYNIPSDLASENFIFEFCMKNNYGLAYCNQNTFRDIDSCFIVTPRNAVKTEMILYSPCIPFNNDYIVMNYGLYKNLFNLKHPFVKDYLINQSTYDKNKLLKDLFFSILDSLLDFMNEIDSKRKPELKLNYINNLTKQINKLLQSKYKFGMKDFPKYTHKFISR